MLYLPILKTKIYLLLLCGLILFHISFLSSKSYTVDLDRLRIINGTEDQYYSCLSSLTNIKAKILFIENTEINYMFNLPHKSIFLIHLGYFFLASALILSAKLSKIELGDDTK